MTKRHVFARVQNFNAVNKRTYGYFFITHNSQNFLFFLPQATLR
jgi:hypothetical protein